MNLQDVRDAVRTQMDLDAEDLPNEVLDPFIREGYDQTIAVEGRWPFFQQSWTGVTYTGGEAARPADLQRVASIIDDATGCRLVQVSHDDAERNGWVSADNTGTPYVWSSWAGTLFLWPRPSSDSTLTIRGWRKPGDWIAAGAASEVDADERLHSVIVHYAVSRAYAQQEDDVLEGIYFQKWLSSLGPIHTAIMRPDESAPTVLNQNKSTRRSWDYR